MTHYDYCIVGAGLFGSVFAHEMTRAGKSCLVIDQRGHIAGNIYSKEMEGIQVHMYGPHIFHTKNQEIWRYMEQFTSFNHFVYEPVANYHGELYNLPFNMNTFYRMWGTRTPEEAQAKIAEQRESAGISSPKNLEEQAISLVGKDIYEKLIKGYTEKQWGASCKELPSFIIRRLPVRFRFDNNYFNDPFQGIPVGGYTQIVEKMLQRADVQLNADYFDRKDYFDNLADRVLYTGCVDRYFDYCFGPLEYRSLRFETETLNLANYQGVAAVNYTDGETPYTRIIEHKHFAFGEQEKTVITREYPAKWEKGMEPYYPINNDKNQSLYQQYARLAAQEPKVMFGGRLAEYRYYDMDQVIGSALNLVQKELI